MSSTRAPSNKSVPQSEEAKLSVLKLCTKQIAHNIRPNCFTTEYQINSTLWQTRLEQATKTSQVAKAIGFMEKHTKWRSQCVEWKEKRSVWVAALLNNPTVSDMASLLLELEQNISWQVVSNEWEGLRHSWIARLAALEEEEDGDVDVGTLQQSRYLVSLS